MAKFVGREPRFLPTFPVTEEAANRLSTTPAIGMNSAAIATYTLTVDSVPSSGGLSMCLAIAMVRPPQPIAQFPQAVIF